MRFLIFYENRKRLKIQLFLAMYPKLNVQFKSNDQHSLNSDIFCVKRFIELFTKFLIESQKMYFL